jgi:hypothetical protein
MVGRFTSECSFAEAMLAAGNHRVQAGRMQAPDPGRALAVPYENRGTSVDGRSG